MGFSSGRLAIGCCARCGTTRNYPDLIEDGNIKGLYVCRERGEGSCYDTLDPYKMAPLPPDSFVLHHPRPDETLTPPDYVLDQDGSVVYGSDGLPLLNT